MHAQSCLTLCDPMDGSPPSSSVHGISQARILEWVIIFCSRGSSWPKDRTQDSCISCTARCVAGGTILKVWLMSGEFDCWHETLLISDLLSPVTTISNVPTCDSSICLVWSENWVEQSHRLTHDEPTAWMRVNLSALKPLKLVVSAPSLASSCNLAPGNLTQSKFLQKDWEKNCRSFLS